MAHVFLPGLLVDDGLGTLQLKASAPTPPCTKFRLVLPPLISSSRKVKVQLYMALKITPSVDC